MIGLVLTRRAPRTDRLRASLIVWGGWTVVTALVFSLMEGIFHQYYTVALAPGIAALVGIGGALLWQRRASRGRAVGAGRRWWWARPRGRGCCSAGRRSSCRGCGGSIVALGVIGAALLLLPGRGRVVAAAALVAAVGSALLGPAAYAVDTVAAAHARARSRSRARRPAVVSAPAVGRGDRDARDRPARRGGTAQAARQDGTAGGAIAQAAPQAAATRRAQRAARQGRQGRRQRLDGGCRQAGFGGPGEASRADPALVGLLQAAGTKWSAATVGSMQAAPLALGSGTDVMAIGGFSGGDPAPTLEQFQSYVADGQVHYFIAGGGFGGSGRGGERGGSTISAWVEQHFTATTVGGRTVYDLTKPKT